MSSTNEELCKLNKCIILNKTAQHVLTEFIGSVKREIDKLSQHQHELLSSGNFSGIPQYHVHRPFLVSSSGEKPPPNADLAARQERKECNIGDIKSILFRRYIKKDMNSFVTYISKCVLEKRLHRLQSKREALLNKLTSVRSEKVASSSTKSNGSDSYGELLRALKDTEASISNLRTMPIMPHCIASTLTASLMKVKNDFPTRKEAWEKRILKRYRNRKLGRAYNVKFWLDLLWDVESELTSADWIDIANHTFKGSMSAANLRLLWFHRISLHRNTTAWTEDEEKRLLALVDTHGPHGKWEDIAKELDTGRSAFSCFQQWQTKLNPSFKLNRPWTGAEDTALLDILKRLLESSPPTLIDWEVVAVYHSTRTSAECMQRAAVLSPVFATSLHTCHSSDAFTSEEDLQLLTGVQRMGTGGGRGGGGGGLGTGSWAVIAASLPGRSALACERRYLTLCEQFQPWTYTEDRNLYRLRLQGEKIDGFIDWKPFYRLQSYRPLIPYFPGRSSKALRQRFLLLLRWSRVWSMLRSLINKQNSDAATSTGDPVFTESQTPEELKHILLRSPFAAQFIRQLRNSGVSDPEAEAFRLFTSWNLKQTHRDPASAIDPEFNLLLDDLVSGLLVPRPLLAQSSLSNAEAPPSSPPLSESAFPNEPISELTLAEAKQLVAYTRIKQMLSGSVRQTLFRTVLQADLPITSKYQKMLTIEYDEEQMKIVLDEIQYNLDSLKKNSSSSQILAAYRLLTDEHLYWSTFDSVMHRLRRVRDMKQLETVAYMQVVAPFIGHMMIRGEVKNEQAVPVSKPTESADLTTSDNMPVTDAICTIQSSPLAKEKAQFPPKNLSATRRRRLVEILRLLRMCGRKWVPSYNAYALCAARWTGKLDPITIIDRSIRPARFAPPVIRRWPAVFAAHVLEDPTSACRYFSDSARSCVLEGLRLAELTPKSSHDNQRPSTSSERKAPSTSANVLPPSYASCAAFKNMLLSLPMVTKKMGSPLSKFVEIRDHLRKNPEGSQNDPESVVDANLLAIIQSPEYSRFLSVGLSLFLWPSLLSCVSAKDFVDAGKRCWQETFDEIPNEAQEYEGQQPASKIPRQDGESSDSDIDMIFEDATFPVLNEGSPRQPSSRRTSNRTRKPKPRPVQPFYRLPRSRFRNGSGRRKMLTKRVVRFQLFTPQDQPVLVTLPVQVKNLLASGFHVESILRLTK